MTSRLGGVEPRNFAAYGAELQNKLDEYYGSAFYMTMMGEVLGRYENHVSINKSKVDAWDIPVLHIETQYTDNEYNMAKDAVEVGTELAHSSGFEGALAERRTKPTGL